MTVVAKVDSVAVTEGVVEKRSGTFSSSGVSVRRPTWVRLDEKSEAVSDGSLTGNLYASLAKLRSNYLVIAAYIT